MTATVGQPGPVPARQGRAAPHQRTYSWAETGAVLGEWAQRELSTYAYRCLGPGPGTGKSRRYTATDIAALAAWRAMSGDGDVSGQRESRFALVRDRVRDLLVAADPLPRYVVADPELATGHDTAEAATAEVTFRDRTVWVLDVAAIIPALFREAA